MARVCAFSGFGQQRRSTGFPEKREQIQSIVVIPDGAALAMSRTIMALYLALLLVLDAPSEPTAGPIPRIRTTDGRLQSLIADGIGRSPTFRALVARLERSDVVVYVHCDARTARGGGRLTFVSSAGGFRYVVVRMGWLPSRAQQIAMLAHELQHAVEIADTPAIVDGPSLAREYRRMVGARQVPAPALTMAFDTNAANEGGHQVLRELMTAAGD